MKSKGQIYFEEFLEKMRTLSNDEIIELLNNEISITGWVTARASYLAAIKYEIERRKIDFSEIGDAYCLSLRSKVILKSNKL